MFKYGVTDRRRSLGWGSMGRSQMAAMAIEGRLLKDAINDRETISRAQSGDGHQMTNVLLKIGI